MAKILVLGAAGLIGAHVVRELHGRGYEVRAFDRQGSNLAGLRDIPIEFMPGDLDDHPALLAAMKGFDAVVHCAGYQALFKDPKHDEQQALRETRNMIQAAQVTKIKRILYVSCFATLGFPTGDGLADESASFPADGEKSGFVRSKMAMEEEILELRHKGMDVLAVVPTATFGPGDVGPNSGRLLQVVGGRKLFVGVKGPANLVDARDVAQGVRLALEKGKTGERYILGGENTTWQHVIEQLSHRLAAKPPKVKVSFGLAKKFADFNEFLVKLRKKDDANILRSRLDAMDFCQHVDDGKARRDLNYTSRPLEETLADTVNWFKLNGYVKPPKKGWKSA